MAQLSQEPEEEHHKHELPTLIEAAVVKEKHRMREALMMEERRLRAAMIRRSQGRYNRNMGEVPRSQA